MIELEKLKAVQEIVVHDNCPDGVASAMILHDVLPEAVITFCQYGTELHKTMPAKPGMLFCDFSPELSRVKDFLDAGTIVLDHHGGPAAEATKAFAEKGLGVFADEKLEPGVCGAVLAYREVWSPLSGAAFKKRYPDSHPLDSETRYHVAHGYAMREFAKLAGVRDTWQKEDPHWQLACEQGEALRFWPWEKIANTPWGKWDSELLAIGPVLYARNMKSVQKCIGASYKFTTTAKGRNVTIFEGLKQSSDAAEVMGEANDLTIGFGLLVENGEPRMLFSTRSRGVFSCQNLALAHGGGGHVRAAGFSVELDAGDLNPYALAQQILAKYEAVEDEWSALVSEPSFKKQVAAGEVEPKKVYRELLIRSQYRHQKFWNIQLDEYQRDNLVWLFSAIGYPAPTAAAIEPFTFANTGDWVGEVAWKLDCHLGVGKPNQSLEWLRDRVQALLYGPIEP